MMVAGKFKAFDGLEVFLRFSTFLHCEGQEELASIS